MNDDLESRLRQYGDALDRAADAAATSHHHHPDGANVVGLSAGRRRFWLRAVATIAASAAVAIGVVVLATRDGGDDTTLIGTDGDTLLDPAPATTPSTSGPEDTLGTPSPTTDPIAKTTDPPTSTRAATSTTEVSTTTLPTVERGPVADCSAAAITTDTGVAVASVLFCDAGWALAIEPGCGDNAEGAECEDAQAFHITEAGWVSDGSVYPFCPDYLLHTGMTVYTALAHSPNVCDPDSPIDPDAPRIELRRGDTGAEVRALQIALVAEGYRVGIDGTFGAGTEAVVRQFQSANNLTADGRAGPATRVALGI